MIRGAVLATVVAGLSGGCERKQSPVSNSPIEQATEERVTGHSEAADSIFVMEGREAPWGDYGEILIHGMSDHLGRKGGDDGPIQLERTGPFVPPITFPGIGNIVVTDAMKTEMEKEEFKGVTFRQVELSKIVEIPWQSWDLKADDPAFYPEGGEPEGYILDREHSPDIAREVGLLWEVVTEIGAEMKRVQTGPETMDVQFEYVDGSWNGSDLFSVKGNNRRYVSKTAREWFDKFYPEWTSFRDGAKH